MYRPPYPKAYNLVVPTSPLKDLTITNYHLLYIGLNIIIIAKYDPTIFRGEASDCQEGERKKKDSSGVHVNVSHDPTFERSSY